MGMAMSGMLGKSAGSAADYPGNSFLGYDRGGVEGVVGHGIKNNGATYVGGLFEQGTPQVVMDTSVKATMEAGNDFLGVLKGPPPPPPDPNKQP